MSQDAMMQKTLRILVSGSWLLPKARLAIIHPECSHAELKYSDCGDAVNIGRQFLFRNWYPKDLTSKSFFAHHHHLVWLRLQLKINYCIYSRYLSRVHFVPAARADLEFLPIRCIGSTYRNRFAVQAN
jgi:hypothetical protein